MLKGKWHWNKIYLQVTFDMIYCQSWFTHNPQNSFRSCSCRVWGIQVLAEAEIYESM